MLVERGYWRGISECGKAVVEVFGVKVLAMVLLVPRDPGEDEREISAIASVRTFISSALVALLSFFQIAVWKVQPSGYLIPRFAIVFKEYGGRLRHCREC